MSEYQEQIFDSITCEPIPRERRCKLSCGTDIKYVDVDTLYKSMWESDTQETVRNPFTTKAVDEQTANAVAKYASVVNKSCTVSSNAKQLITFVFPYHKHVGTIICKIITLLSRKYQLTVVNLLKMDLLVIINEQRVSLYSYGMEDGLPDISNVITLEFDTRKLEIEALTKLSKYINGRCDEIGVDYYSLGIDVESALSKSTCYNCVYERFLGTIHMSQHQQLMSVNRTCVFKLNAGEPLKFYLTTQSVVPLVDIYVEMIKKLKEITSREFSTVLLWGFYAKINGEYESVQHLDVIANARMVKFKFRKCKTIKNICESVELLNKTDFSKYGEIATVVRDIELYWSAKTADILDHIEQSFV